MNTAQSEMPRYRCHKEVHALQISEVGVTDLHFEESGFESVNVGPSWMTRHNPHVGGYYVVYDDGYTSFSPQGTFEAGYTLIS